MKVKRETVDFVRDEHIRDDASLEGMAKLKPVFKREGGTVTAGNASGMNDAGAAVVLMDVDRAKELGATARARILAYASCGVDPAIMGIGPVPAVKKVLERSGRSLDEIGVIELNEAFAAQALAVMQGARPRPRENESQRRGDRTRPPDRRDWLADHREDPRRDGAGRPRARARDAVHRRRSGDRAAARARVAADFS